MIQERLPRIGKIVDARGSRWFSALNENCMADRKNILARRQARLRQSLCEKLDEKSWTVETNGR